MEEIVSRWGLSVAQLRIHQECPHALDPHATITAGLANGLSIFCKMIPGGFALLFFFIMGQEKLQSVVV